MPITILIYFNNRFVICVILLLHVHPQTCLAQVRRVLIVCFTLRVIYESMLKYTYNVRHHVPHRHTRAISKAGEIEENTDTIL